MKRAPLILLGIFGSLALSWTGVVLSNQHSYGKLEPVFDEAEGKLFPETLPGIAAQGKLVYQDLGCVTCHTQQVRRPGFGTDEKRGWGQRGSVARDYIKESRVLLGSMRIGPDLRNVGARPIANRDWHYRHLFDPTLTTPGSTMPRHAFLFETRKILGEPSPKAVQNLLPAQYQPAAGYEIVPTPRGEALVEYLLSLKDTYNYPEEAKRVVTETPPKDQKDAKAPNEHGQAEQSKKVEGHK